MILIDATPLQSEHRLRGVGAYVRHLVQHLEAKGHKPFYFASTVGLEHVQDLLPLERTLSVYRPHTPAQVYWAYNELAMRWAILRLRPRVFFCPDFNGIVSNPFGESVPMLHDLIPLKVPEEGEGLGIRLSRLRWQVYFAKVRRARHIIARSEQVKKDAVQMLGIAPERITVVAQGLDRERFVESTGQGPYAAEPPYFLHVGGSGVNKNMRRVLEAFAKVAPTHPQTRLYFVGPWAPAEKEWLEAEKTRLGLFEQVRHLGFIPDTDLPGLYGNAAAVVFPSLEEGYGLPVLEGMASGAPVITSNVSSLPEVAGDAALLVNPLEVEAIAAAMCRILDEPGLAQALRQKGRVQASQFSWEALADQVWESLNRIAER
ncbi:MAG TPA: glycosyltransferase family 1 protein [Meiothermus sp.]|jgi:glycosyltransferase involved in cell wall biosynthesis|nr:glycosyltransferase family 1 protein [Meiothermus sp.]